MEFDMVNPPILTVPELAEHLNVHPVTIYRLLKSGDLPGFRVGRVWRFDLHQVTEWLGSGESIQSASSATADD
jgi:excisionase family DNA binding protein